MRSAVESLTTAVRGFLLLLLLLLLTLPVTQSQRGYSVTYTSTEVCAPRGSTVDITSSYSYPDSVNDHVTTVQESFWFIKESNGDYVDLRSDPDYSGRVEYLNEERKSTLRIRDLRESDSSEYKFRFVTNQDGGKLTGEPGVTLSVTDLQVKVEKIQVYSSSCYADLSCQSSCRLPDRSSYIWYKNHQKIQEGGDSYSGYFSSSDTVSCAVKGHESVSSPPLLIYKNKGYSVTYTSTEVCVLRGSTVDITSSYSYPGSVDDHVTTVQESFWFIKESNGVYVDLRSDPDYSGRVEYLNEDRKSTLRIRDLRESDSAEYKFRFVTNQDGGKLTGEPGVTLSVTGLQVKVEKIQVYSSSSSSSSCYADLSCQSSCRLPDRSSYIWYKNQQKIQERRESYSDYFSSLDTVSCAVKGHESVLSPSLLIYKNKGYSVTYTSTEVCVLRGSTVDITSSYSYPGSVNDHVTTVQESFWFIKVINDDYVDLRSDPDYSGRVEYLNEDRKSTLRIRDLRESDSAEYKFRFVTNQYGVTGEPGVTLSVRDPQLQIDVRRSVGQFSTWTQLTCHSSCQLSDHFSYVWYKNGQRAGGKNYLHFDNISPTDSFDCTIEGHEQIRSPPVYAPRTPSVSVSPPGQIMEGSSVTLTCSSDANPAANYTWYKENINTVISTEQNFTITNVTTEHGGNYQCEVQNRVGRQNTTKHLVVRAVPLRALESAFIGTSTAILLAVVVVFLIFLIRKKMSPRQVAEARERPDNRELAEEQHEPHYASIQFVRTSRDPVYSNVMDYRSGRHGTQEIEDDVLEYSVVKFTHSEPRPSNQVTVEDPAVLYSTVKKPCS